MVQAEEKTMPASVDAVDGRQREALRLTASRSAVPVAVVLAWALAATASDLVPTPLATFTSLIEGFTEGWIVSPLVDTLKAVAGGFAVAVLVGVTAGIVLGVSAAVSDVLDPVIAGLFAVPRIILYPVILAIFGVGLEAKLWMAAFSAVFPIMLNTGAGVRSVSPTLVKLGRSVGCGALSLVRYVYLPSATPAVMVGIRIGMSISFISVVIAELFAAVNGLGLEVQSSYGLQNYPKMFSVVLLITVIALVMNLVLWSAERRVRTAVD